MIMLEHWNEPSERRLEAVRRRFWTLGRGIRLSLLQLTTADEDAMLAATERVSHVEVTALAVSSDCKVVAVETSIGQVKLYGARDRRAGAIAGRSTRRNSRTSGLRRTGRR